MLDYRAAQFAADWKRSAKLQASRMFSVKTVFEVTVLSRHRLDRLEFLTQSLDALTIP